MAAKSGRDDMKVRSQFSRDPVPVTAMVTTAMEQDERRSLGVAPVNIMQLQPLRDVDVRGEIGEGVFRHWTILRFSRSEEHTSELQSLMRISYAVFCLKKKKKQTNMTNYYKTVNTKIRVV